MRDCASFQYGVSLLVIWLDGWLRVLDNRHIQCLMFCVRVCSKVPSHVEPGYIIVMALGFLQHRAVELGAGMGRFQGGRAVSVLAVRDRVGEVVWG